MAGVTHSTRTIVALQATSGHGMTRLDEVPDDSREIHGR